MKFKKTFLMSVAVLTVFTLTGCGMGEIKEKASIKIASIEESVSNKISSIPVPFEWFKGSSKEIQSFEAIEVKGFNIAKEPVELKDMKDFQVKLTEIEEVLQDKDNFKLLASGEKSLMNLVGSGSISFKHEEQVDGIAETLKDLGSEPHQWVKGLTLRQFGVRLNSDGEKVNHAIVDVNAINDTENFRIQTLELSLDDTGAIKSSIQVGEPSDTLHTRTPLTENSLFYADTHKEFEQSLKQVVRVLSNEMLYEDLKEDKENGSDVTIGSVVKKLGIDEKNSKTLLELLLKSKGEFKQWGITGYLFDDENVTGITMYELVFSDEDGYHFYNLHYKRGTKEITNIEKGSPFEEVYK